MIEFGKSSRKRKQRIISKDDERLILVDPSVDGFFDKVLNYDTENVKINAFIKAVNEVKKASILAFRKPIYDPALTTKGTVIFEVGKTPATGYNIHFWEKKVKKMPSVNGLKWSVGSEYQYYAFLTWLINQLVDDEGWEIKRAIEAVVLDSRELGHYENLQHEFKMTRTGSRKIGKVYDLANTYKMLRCTNSEVRSFWLAGGHFGSYSDDVPLASLHQLFNGFYWAVGWLVLS